jgi:hypothetical protein
MIDRKKLVSRHNINLKAADIWSPLSVGNGRFVFTADITGLQTLGAWYEDGVTLNTMAEWGWNSHPNVDQVRFEESLLDVDTYGRSVSYPLRTKSMQTDWLRANPHQSNLAQIAFVTRDLFEHDLGVDDIQNVHQELDLWHGKLVSQFKLAGYDVLVETMCHPEQDTIGIRVVTPLIANGKLGVSVRFPYTSAAWGRSPSDWGHSDRHNTRVVSQANQSVVIEHKLDDLAYECAISSQEKVTWELPREHCVELWTSRPDMMELNFTVSFSKNLLREICVQEVREASEKHWVNFWKSGGAIDLSESIDARWMELERRIVLSQYVTAIQSCGALPPAETGLTCNSWFGKFHLEMHWWHGVHFALWGRIGMLENNLVYYQKIIGLARETAQRQGYKGVRWPKMVGPEGHESPSGVGPMLIWQQPHPIYYAELCYRQHQNEETLNLYREIVFETADFMASYAHWNDQKAQYDLGPPLIPAQENHKYAVTKNPTYELEYWHWALEVAQQWRVRLGLCRNDLWDHVISHLAPLPEKEGLYLAAENRQDSWGDPDLWRDHPSFLAALGVMPGRCVDKAKMQATLAKTRDVWDWERAWGWDFPVAAMCAARLGLGELAIDLLLLDVVKNRYLLNGHNFQAERLPLYLPGNGGLLTTVAMMAAGWDGADDEDCPGFPQNGQWKVKWEGLKPMP